MRKSKWCVSFFAGYIMHEARLNLVRAGMNSSVEYLKMMYYLTFRFL